MSDDTPKEETKRTELPWEKLEREAKESRVRIFLLDPTPELDSIEFAKNYILNRGVKTETELENMSKMVDALKEQIESMRRERIPAPWLYIVILVIVVAGTAALVVYGWAEKPEVSIEYNVGEIIGGLFAGIGALIAAVAYALRGRG
jgi:hypothetical protein